MTKNYYVYIWMTDAPYYVGKGKNKRAYNKYRNFGKMRPNTQILFFRQNLSERSALRIEDLLVEKWGRKCDGGILENIADPKKDFPHCGSGKGRVVSAETRQILHERTTNFYKNAENRKKHSDDMKKYYDDPNAITKRGNDMKRFYENPNNREKAKKSQLKRYSDPKQRELTSVATKKGLAKKRRLKNSRPFSG